MFKKRTNAIAKVAYHAITMLFFPQNYEDIPEFTILNPDPNVPFPP